MFTVFFDFFVTDGAGVASLVFSKHFEILVGPVCTIMNRLRPSRLGSPDVSTLPGLELECLEKQIAVFKTRGWPPVFPPVVDFLTNALFHEFLSIFSDTHRNNIAHIF